MSKPKGLAEQRFTSKISAIASLALLGSLDVLNYERKAPRPLPDVRGSHVRERGLDFVECCKAAQSPHNLFCTLIRDPLGVHSMVISCRSCTTFGRAHAHTAL